MGKKTMAPDLSRSPYPLSRLVSIVILTATVIAIEPPQSAQGIPMPQAPDAGAPAETIGAGSRLIEYPQRLPLLLYQEETPVIAPAPMELNNGAGSSIPNREFAPMVPNVVPRSGDRLPEVIPLLPPDWHLSSASTTPNLYFYVDLERSAIVDFVVTQGDSNKRYRREISLEPGQGLVKLAIPPQALLETQEIYDWQLSIRDDFDAIASQTLQGTLQVVAPDTELALLLVAKGDLLAQARVYAAAYYWHETLELVRQLSAVEPQALADLLDSVGVGPLDLDTVLYP